MPSFTFAATASGGALLRRARRCSPTSSRASDPSLDPERRRARGSRRARRRCASVHYAGYAAAVDRLAELCDEHGIALIEDVAHAPSATLDGRKLGTWGLAGAFSFFSNKVLSVGEGGLLCTDDDEVAAFARSRRSHAMTSGTWDRHTRPHRHLRRDRARLQLPPRRAARGAAAVAPGAAGGGHRAPARADRALPRAALAEIDGDHRAVRRTPTCRAPPAT